MENSLRSMEAAMNYIDDINIGHLPHRLFTGLWDGGHIQGIALDKAHRFLYCSFTTQLVKLDLKGHVIGSVRGLLGHLGCLAFNKQDGKLYGSLEFKQDAIGQGILRNISSDKQLETAFYVAVFDVDKIDRLDMDAEKDGIMTTVWLSEVVADHLACWKQDSVLVRSRHGCSGIDGITFGPDFGAKADSKFFLCVAYGIYGDTKRQDNDYQVLLQYDTENWNQLAQRLNQDKMHRSGPVHCRNKYFVLTGNTEWGVQNLEYDPFTGHWLMAVYSGRKKQYPNYTLFLVDGTRPAVNKPLQGDPDDRQGDVLSLADAGRRDVKTGLRGWFFPHGSTGLYAFGHGLYYFALHKKIENQYAADICLYRWNGQSDGPFEQVTEI